MADETVRRADDTTAEVSSEAADDKGGIRIAVSASVVSAIIAAVTTMITQRTTSTDTQTIVDRVRNEVMKEASREFVVKGVDDTRWSFYTQGVDERLRSIAEKLDSIDRRTSDLPRIAAKLEIMERQGK